MWFLRILVIAWARAIVLRQLPNLDRWDWGRLDPRVYLGDYSLRGKGARGLATALVSGPEEDLSIEFNPAIEPGQAVNVVFRGFNPQSSIYQWSTELLADGEDPVQIWVLAFPENASKGT